MKDEHGVLDWSVALPAGAPSFQFHRPTWQWLVMVLTPVWFIVPMLIGPLVRVWIGGDALVIARGGEHGGRRIARAAVVAIRRTRGDLAIIIRDVAPATLAPAGKPHRAAVGLGRRLAHALAVPFVDETGATARLPMARALQPRRA